MSWSLAITNGDLAFGTQGLNTVTGATKLTQDLRCAILESTGTDPLHPTFGSTLDGGIDASGNHVEGVIGQINDSGAAIYIRTEIQRVARVYQAQQIARNSADVATYGRSTLTADEALLSMDAINIQQVMDQVLVNATLTTGAGGVPLNLPFSTF